MIWVKIFCNGNTSNNSDWLCFDQLQKNKQQDDTGGLSEPLALKLEYSWRSRSIPWLLMPWLLVSPGHQQPWYWLHTKNRSLSTMRNDFNYLCHVSVEKYRKHKHISTFCGNKFNMTNDDIQFYIEDGCWHSLMRPSLWSYDYHWSSVPCTTNSYTVFIIGQALSSC